MLPLNNFRAHFNQLGPGVAASGLLGLLYIIEYILYAPSNSLNLLFLPIAVPITVAMLRGNPAAVTAGAIAFVIVSVVSTWERIAVGSRLWPHIGVLSLFFLWCFAKARSRGKFRDVALLLIPAALYLAFPFYYLPARWKMDCPSAGIQNGDLVLFEKSHAPSPDRIPEDCLGSVHDRPAGRPVAVLGSDANPRSRITGVFRPSQIRWDRMFQFVARPCDALILRGVSGRLDSYL